MGVFGKGCFWVFVVFILDLGRLGRGRFVGFKLSLVGFSVIFRRFVSFVIVVIYSGGGVFEKSYYFILCFEENWVFFVRFFVY